MDQDRVKTGKDVDDTSTSYKIQFEFSLAAKRRLEDLMRKIGAKTRAEVVRNALRLYEWIIDQVEDDMVIVVEDKSGRTIFRIPASTLRQV
ncbi:MAG TPA: hypothetical protein VKT82_05965 [Ktedonobacterales bacterium]|nr:hypothetical protein [Ktedonobacterales bacterium]